MKSIRGQFAPSAGQAEQQNHPAAEEPTGEAPAALDHVEVEWQYEAPDPQAAKEWLLALESFRAEQRKTARIHDSYLDTPDFKVMRAGYALRIRTSGGRAETSLKELVPGEDGLAVRREISQPLASAQKAALFEQAGPVSSRLRLLCRQHELRSLAVLRTERQTFSVTAESGTGAEVALDRTFLTDPLGRTHRLTRVEIEVAEEDVPVFRPLAERMRAECGLQEALLSKFQWALEANGIRADRHMNLGSWQTGPSMTVGQVADAVLRRHLASFLWHDPGTRLGEDAEHLHDMRVACRRMRAALKLFRRAWPEGEADDLRRRLGEAGRRLGEVRDLDVLMAHLRDHCGALLTAGSSGCAPLLNHLGKERERARVRMIAALESEEFGVLARDLLALAHRGAPAGRPTADTPILRFAPPRIRRARRRILRQGEKLTPDSPAPEFHQVRILAKHLRYTLEFHAEVFDGATAELITACVDIQDLLGLHQDAQVTVRMLRAIVSEQPPGFPAEGWTAVGELAQAFHSEAAALRRRMPRLLRRLRGKRWRRFRRSMKRALAHLEAAEKRAAKEPAAGARAAEVGAAEVEAAEATGTEQAETSKAGTVHAGAADPAEPADPAQSPRSTEPAAQEDVSSEHDDREE